MVAVDQQGISFDRLINLRNYVCPSPLLADPLRATVSLFPVRNRPKAALDDHGLRLKPGVLCGTNGGLGFDLLGVDGKGELGLPFLLRRWRFSSMFDRDPPHSLSV